VDPLRLTSRHLAAGASVLALAAAAPAFAAGPIDGRWQGTATLAELVRAGVSQTTAGKLCGTATGPCVPAAVSFANGHFRFHTRAGGTATGTYRLEGKHIRFVFVSGLAVKPGEVAECGWSVYRDRLTFTKLPGRPCDGWDAAPWVRG
jgi:hypothetical protein